MTKHKERCLSCSLTSTALAHRRLSVNKYLSNDHFTKKSNRQVFNIQNKTKHCIKNMKKQLHFAKLNFNEGSHCDHKKQLPIVLPMEKSYCHRFH